MVPPIKSTLKMGWMLVMFDLPVTTKKQQKIATLFRNRLLGDGYSMLQFSVYMRSCSSWERMKKHAHRLRLIAPSGGNIKAIMITEKQWEKSITIMNKTYRQTKKLPKLQQLDIFENW